METSRGKTFRHEPRLQSGNFFLIDPDADTEKTQIFSTKRKKSKHRVFNDFLIGNKENQLAVFRSASVMYKKLDRFQLDMNNRLPSFILSTPFTIDYRLKQN